VDNLSSHQAEDGTLTLVNKVDGNRQEGVEAIDSSYTYIPWVLDRVSDTDKSDISMHLLMALISLSDVIGISDSEIGELSDAPLQLIDATHGMFSLSREYRHSNDAAGFSAAVDSDITVEEGNGNGGGDTVYRTRQGVERFLITDINNPAAGAKAASNVFVLYDNVSLAADQFNHAPGGSNVLYMDGHVEFQRYPGPPPVGKKMSAIMRVFDYRPHH
jgi:prepilin-type processing-associated H-X9-DG protein